jgi:hypothetical protein
MLEKPDLQDERIIACLRDEYGLLGVRVDFLPLGADRNTAVYRVVADDETPYFLKLRGGVFDETSVALPKFLSDRGALYILSHNIASITATKSRICGIIKCVVLSRLSVFSSEMIESQQVNRLFS